MASCLCLSIDVNCLLVFLQEIELKKSQWSALFEPYIFFEAYKNYLQVDIVAADDDDLLAWKGWVESRLRQLTLKVIFMGQQFVEQRLLSLIIISFHKVSLLRQLVHRINYLCLCRLSETQMECFSAIHIQKSI